MLCFVSGVTICKNAVAGTYFALTYEILTKEQTTQKKRDLRTPLQGTHDSVCAPLVGFT